MTHNEKARTAAEFLAELEADPGYFALDLDRPVAERAAPRPRAALPLAPADRFPVTFENTSRTRPAILSIAPSTLFRLADLAI